MFRSILASGTAALALLASAGTATATPVYIVHGIPGSALGVDEDLLVDIEVDGTCALTEVPFGTIAEEDLPAGPYEIAVYLSDGECGGLLAFTSRINVAAFGTAIAIADLDPNGTPELSELTVNTTPADLHNAQLTVYHEAAAPAVEVALASGGRPVATFEIAADEQTFPAEVEPGNYDVTITLVGGEEPVLEIEDLPLAARTSYAAIAVGALTPGATFAVLLVEIPAS